MNKSGDIAFSASYDAWGKQTISKSTLNLRRGYCQHEHWNAFDLIDMNGRMYDPSVGRFLSPDPYVQNATNPQNFNRYSYCLNNPLKYTDPSGMQQVINNDAMPYKELDNGIRFHAPTIPYHTSRRSNGGYGYGGSYGGYGSYGSSPVSYDGFGYTLYDPKTINEFYASGMSLSDWIDQMVYEDKAIYTKMLDEVTVRAYDQSSYNRAAIDIWAQVHYGDYSGGWWQLGQSFASGDGVVSGRGSGGGKTIARSTSAKLSGPDAAGVQISFAFYVGMGASIDVLIGENRNGRHFLSVNLNAGIGLDLGMGAGIFTSYYSHGENSPLNIYPTTMEGRGKYIGGGMGLGYSYSTSYISESDLSSGEYDQWTTNSFFIMSPKIGGSMGISKTFVPIIR